MPELQLEPEAGAVNGTDLALHGSTWLDGTAVLPEEQESLLNFKFGAVLSHQKKVRASRLLSVPHRPTRSPSDRSLHWDAKEV